MLARLLPSDPIGRILALNALIASLGFGGFAVASSVFFTHSIGLTLREVGFGLSVSGLAQLLVSVPGGWICDRFCPRDIVIASTLANAVVLLSYVLVNSLAAFVAVAATLGMLHGLTHVAQEALLAALVPADNRVVVSAYVRTAVNAGFTVGALIAGLVVVEDSRAAYLGLLLVNVLAEVCVALLTLRVPRTRHRVKREAVRLGGALRDRPYVAVSLVCGVLFVAQTVLDVGVPIWILDHTHAPRVLAGWLFAINTVLIVAFQVRASRAIDNGAKAGPLVTKAFAAAAVSFVLIGASTYGNALVATLLLIAGVVMLSVGELWGSAAQWALRFDLADPQAQGQYGGVFALGSSVQNLVGPIVVTTATSALLFGGWLLLAAVMIVGGMIAAPVVRWAEQMRQNHFV